LAKATVICVLDLLFAQLLKGKVQPVANAIMNLLERLPPASARASIRAAMFTVVLTMRPRCSAIFGSPNSRRIAFSAARVPSSSSLISRE
jgi:hypothetical protein